MKTIYKVSPEVALNLFNDCLTDMEQHTVANKLGFTKDTVQEVDPSELEHQVLLYLRG